MQDPVVNAPLRVEPITASIIPASSEDLTLLEAKERETFLFGVSRPWSTTDWTASDDRVRGGRSISHFEVLTSSASPPTSAPSPTAPRRSGDGHTSARVYGNLDPSVLGAGFASQRTVGEQRWNLAAYDGLRVRVTAADDKTYTLVVKDEILPKRSDGRERSSLSWEADFRGRGDVLVPWGRLVPTYRGRRVEGKTLDVGCIKRIHIMIRSFFGDQEGDFSLTIESISAFKLEHGHDETDDEDELHTHKGAPVEERSRSRTRTSPCGCIVL